MRATPDKSAEVVSLLDGWPGWLAHACGSGFMCLDEIRKPNTLAVHQSTPKADSQKQRIQQHAQTRTGKLKPQQLDATTRENKKKKKKGNLRTTRPPFCAEQEELKN